MPQLCMCSLHCRQLHRAHAVDLDDLLGLTVAVLQAHPPVLEYLQSRYHQIWVDEFQVGCTTDLLHMYCRCSEVYCISQS
jgi:hypothetical protein